MSKFTYRTANGRLTAEFDADSQTSLFEQIAAFDEIFGDTAARKNGEMSEITRFQVREVDGNKYYEMVCVDPNSDSLRYAKKAFGLKKDGKTLFPKPLKDAEDKTVYDNGLPVMWRKYNPKTQTEE